MLVGTGPGRFGKAGTYLFYCAHRLPWKNTPYFGNNLVDNSRVTQKEPKAPSLTDWASDSPAPIGIVILPDTSLLSPKWSQL